MKNLTIILLLIASFFVSCKKGDEPVPIINNYYIIDTTSVDTTVVDSVNYDSTVHAYWSYEYIVYDTTGLIAHQFFTENTCDMSYWLVSDTLVNTLRITDTCSLFIHAAFDPDYTHYFLNDSVWVREINDGNGFIARVYQKKTLRQDIINYLQ